MRRLIKIYNILIISPWLYDKHIMYKNKTPKANQQELLTENDKKIILLLLNHNIIT